MLKALFIALGVLAVGLGALGVVVPGLPTTPFLLLAAALFLRSSDRLYRGLVSSPLLGPYIRSFRDQGGMTLRAKIVSLSIMWAMIGASVWTLRAPAVRLAIVAVGVAGTAVMGWLVRTAKGKRSNLDKRRHRT